MTRSHKAFAAAVLAVVLALPWLVLTSGVADHKLPQPLAHHTATTAAAVPEVTWGHVMAHSGQYIFSLGPVIDARHRYELGLFQRNFSHITGVYVGDTAHLYPLRNFQPMGSCGAHIWGNGVNMIIAWGKCVPQWATVSFDPKQRHAGAWIRVENLVGQARIVLITYDPVR